MTAIELHPHDAVLEKTAISMLLTRIRNINKVDKHCFYVEEYRKIFEAIKKTNSVDVPVIEVESGVSADVIYNTLAELVSESSDEYIIKELHKYKDSRMVMRGIYKLEAQAKSLDIAGAKETLGKLTEIIDVLHEDETLETQLVDYFKSIDEENKFIPCGINEIDKTCLFKGGQLVVVAGRPGMGKTTVLQNMAIRQAAKHKVGFVSLEMGIGEIIDRFICMLSGLTSYEIQNKKENVSKIMEYLEKMMNRKLFLSTKIHTVDRIEAYIVKNKLDVCYVDYLGLIDQGNKRISVNDAIADITRKLKLIALKYNVKIVLGVQLNRNVEGRPNKIPQLSDLRDSGSIEQDADIVLMLYREEYYDKDTDRHGTIDVFVRKNRNGETKDVILASDLSRFRIYGDTKPL